MTPSDHLQLYTFFKFLCPLMNVNSHPNMVPHQLVLLHIQKVVTIIQTYGSFSHSAPHAASRHPEFFTEGGGLALMQYVIYV
jgi:hypothetical protein